MEYIYIKSCDAVGQYDEDYNQIVEWDEKACNWFVLPEYENCILEYEEDENGISDIPRAAYRSDYPDIDKNPDIRLSIQYDCDGKTYYDSRYWGYLDYNKNEAIKNLGEYYLNTVCKDFTNVYLKLYYNDEFIWEGKS